MNGANPFGVETPCILIDVEVVENNLARMQGKAEKFNASLRPHIKTHKTPELAHMQMDMGACGITTAKISEAEVMAKSGIKDIFIANQIVTETKLKRLLALAREIRVSVGLDSLEGAKALSQAFSAEGSEIEYLIEIDSGLERCGVQPGRPAVELFRAIQHLPVIRFKGLFTHAGHVYRQRSLEEIRDVSQIESRCMTQTVEYFQALHVQPEVVSVGSTPTMKVWEGYPGVTEMRPGNYIFNDAIQIALGVAKAEECALTVLATVISRPNPLRAVIDAGSKVLALDKGTHGNELLRGFGMVLEKKVIIERLSEEHGILSLDSSDELSIGETIRIIPNHACPVVNLFDTAYGIRDAKVEKKLKIAGRGKVY